MRRILDVPMRITTETEARFNVIDHVLEGQQLHTTQRRVSGLVTFEVSQINGKAIALTADDGTKVTERFRRLAKAQVGPRWIYAVESSEPLVDGEQQHVRMDMGDVSFYMLPFKERDLQVGEYYRLLIALGKGKPEERTAQLTHADSNYGLFFKGYNERTEQTHRFLVKRHHLTLNPNFRGVAIYPHPVALRNAIMGVA